MTTRDLAFQIDPALWVKQAVGCGEDLRSMKAATSGLTPNADGGSAGVKGDHRRRTL